jgi:Rad3-related DNA helicase
MMLSRSGAWRIQAKGAKKGARPSFLTSRPAAEVDLVFCPLQLPRDPVILCVHGIQFAQCRIFDEAHNIEDVAL